MSFVIGCGGEQQTQNQENATGPLQEPGWSQGTGGLLKVRLRTRIGVWLGLHCLAESVFSILTTIPSERAVS